MVGGVEEIVGSYIKVLLPDPRAEHQALGMEGAFGKYLMEIVCFTGVTERRSCSQLKTADRLKLSNVPFPSI